jgi:pyrimidine-specific ribonucleoside hydrolase
VTSPPPAAARIPVVLDVDTGVDDACALLLAGRQPGLDLLAVTCVAGNADVDQVVANSLVVLDAAGRPDVPVARGASRPLLEPARAARHVHGQDGMGDLALPPSARVADPRHAVDLLRDVLVAAHESGRPVTLVPLAPLTNIALLLRMYPEAAAGLARIVFMGGAALVGNATAAAEFNVWHDVRVTRERAAAMAALPAVQAPATNLAGRLIGFQCDRFGEESASIGDAGAVCAVVDPAGLTTRSLPVRVELAGTWTRGQTIVDQRDTGLDHANDPHGLAPAVLDVALGVDADRYRDLWLASVGG